MKEIKLTQGKFALVDDEDYDFLMQWKWHARKLGKRYYAGRQEKSINRRRKLVHMHRLIMHTPEGMEVDHQDHNGLNNQKYNLRNCTHKNNSKNRTSYGKSNYLGVYWYKKYNCWNASLRINGETKNQGYFKTEEEAALAYNEAALKFHGNFANLNIIP